MNELPVCIFCGAETDNWWYLDGRINVCRCRDCYENGAALTEPEEALYAQFLSILAKYQEDTKRQEPLSPISESDLSIWDEHITKGSERLRKWAVRGAMRYLYRGK